MTSRSIFSLTAALLLSVFVAGGLWAQTAPHDIVTSPQSTASEGRYRSDADNFIRTDSWSGLKFNTFYAFTSFYPGAANRAALGFATKFGDIYVAAYYSGNFWSGTTTFSHTETSQTSFYNKTFSSYTTALNTPTLAFDTPIPDNRVAILLGVADMGFRISYAWTHESFKKDDIMTVFPTTVPNPDHPNYGGTDPDAPLVIAGPPGNAFYKNYQMDYGVIAPQIEWGMAKTLTEKNGIQPKVTINLNFVRDYLKYEQYDATDGSTNGERTARSQNYFSPHLIATLGGYHFYNENGFRATADLDYELSFRVYDNEYSYMYGGAYRTDKIKGLNNNGNYSENSYILNLVTPSLAGQWSGGNLALRFKLNLPFQFTYAKATGMNLYDGFYLVKNGADSDTSTFVFSPNLRLAAQWRALPDKLHLYAGARLNLGNITHTNVDSVNYTTGVATRSTKTITDTFTNTANNFRLGVTFLPTQNLILEAACGIGTNNSISVFDPNGLLNFTTLLASLKF